MNIHDTINKLDEYIWYTIFVVSRSYDDVETQSCSVRLLIMSMKYMLSEIAKKYNYTSLKNRFDNTVCFFKEYDCICEENFKDKCPSTNELYEFMKKYYNYCVSRENKQIIQYPDFDVVYNIDKMTKPEWGKRLWFIMHTFAALYLFNNNDFLLEIYSKVRLQFIFIKFKYSS